MPGAKTVFGFISRLYHGINLLKIEQPMSGYLKKKPGF